VIVYRCPAHGHIDVEHVALMAHPPDGSIAVCAVTIRRSFGAALAEIGPCHLPLIIFED
jgi:hypothetical protein